MLTRLAALQPYPAYAGRRPAALRPILSDGLPFSGSSILTSSARRKTLAGSKKKVTGVVRILLFCTV